MSFKFLQEANKNVASLLALVANHCSLGHLELGAALYRTAVSNARDHGKESVDNSNNQAQRWIDALLKDGGDDEPLWTNQYALPCPLDFDTAAPTAVHVRYFLQGLAGKSPSDFLLRSSKRHALIDALQNHSNSLQFAAIVSVLKSTHVTELKPVEEAELIDALRAIRSSDRILFVLTVEALAESPALFPAITAALFQTDNSSSFMTGSNRSRENDFDSSSDGRPSEKEIGCLYNDVLAAEDVLSASQRAAILDQLRKLPYMATSEVTRYFLDVYNNPALHIGSQAIHNGLSLVQQRLWSDLKHRVGFFPQLASVFPLIAWPFVTDDSSARMELVKALLGDEQGSDSSPSQIFQPTLVGEAQRLSEELSLLQETVAHFTSSSLKIGSLEFRDVSNETKTDIMAYLSRYHSTLFVLQGSRAALDNPHLLDYLSHYSPLDAALWAAWRASMMLLDDIAPSQPVRAEGTFRLLFCIPFCLAICAFVTFSWITDSFATNSVLFGDLVETAVRGLGGEAALSWLQTLYSLSFIQNDQGDFVLSSWSILKRLVEVILKACTLLQSSPPAVTFMAELSRVLWRVNALSAWPRTSLPWLFASNEALIVRALRVRDWDSALSLIQGDENRSLVLALRRFQSLLSEKSFGNVSEYSAAESLDLAVSRTVTADSSIALLRNAVEKSSKNEAIASLLKIAMEIPAEAELASYLTSVTHPMNSFESFQEVQKSLKLRARLLSNSSPASTSEVSQVGNNSFISEVALYFAKLSEFCSNTPVLSHVNVYQSTPNELLKILLLNGKTAEAETLSRELRIPLVATFLEAVTSSDRLSPSIIEFIAKDDPTSAILSDLEHGARISFSTTGLVKTAEDLGPLKLWLQRRLRLALALESGELGLNADAVAKKDKVLAESLLRKAFTIDSSMADEAESTRTLIEFLALQGHGLKAIQLAKDTLDGGASDSVRAIVGKLRVSDAESLIVIDAIRGIGDPLMMAPIVSHHLEAATWSLEVASDMVRLVQSRLKLYVARSGAQASPPPKSLSELEKTNTPIAIHSLQQMLNRSVNSSNAEAELVKMERWSSLLKSYAAVLAVVKNRWYNWGSLHGECLKSLPEVVSELSAAEVFDAAADLARLHSAPPSLLARIEEQALLAILRRCEAEKDLDLLQASSSRHPLVLNALQRLRSVHHSRLFVLYLRLATRVGSNATRLFMARNIRSLLGEVAEGGYEEVVNELGDHETALAMLLQLPADLQRTFEVVLLDSENEGVPMHERSLRLIESLLMSELTAHVSAILQGVSTLQSSSGVTDAIFLHYASKAIFDSMHSGSSQDLTAKDKDSASNPDGSESSEPVAEEVQVDSISGLYLGASTSGSIPSVSTFHIAREWRLCGSEAAVSTLRKQHRFVGTPRHRLASAFLDLCKDVHLVVDATLKWCNVLSERLQRVADTRLVHVHVIEALIHYAKRRLVTDTSFNPHSASDLEECDTYLSRVSLLLQLLLSSVDLGGTLNLATFSNPHKCRLLRDRLIELDHVALAIEVAGKCGVEAEPVWAHWSFPASLCHQGLTLLRVGRYAEAKEKFGQCLTLNPAFANPVPTGAPGEGDALSPDPSPVKSVSSPSGAPTVALAYTGSTAVPPSPGGRLYPAHVPTSPTISQAPSSAAIPPQAFVTTMNKLVLQRILKVLESGAPPEPSQLRGKFHELRKEVHRAQKAQKRGDSVDTDASMDVESYMRALGRTPPAQKAASTLTSTFLSFFAPKQAARPKNSLDSARYMQAIYYLQRYGSAEDLIGFWLRHHLYEDALRFILTSKLSSQAFVQVVVTALSENLLDRLKEIVRKIDPSLVQWKRYLTAACRYFYQRQMLTILLDLQVFMKDFVRAGRTSIKLFMRATTYMEQRTHLEQAKDHFLKALADLNGDWEQGSTGAEDEKVDEADEAVRGPAAIAAVSAYLKQINLQLEVTAFAEATPAIGELVAIGDKSATSLFGGAEQMSALTELIVFHGNYDLAFRLLQECHLSAPEIYSRVMERLATDKNTGAMQGLLRSVQGMLEDDERDVLVRRFVDLLITQFSDLKTAELWAVKLSAPALRVRALIQCMKLKLAYMEAVKIADAELVKEVRDAAVRWGMAREAELCEQYLVQNYTQ